MLISSTKTKLLFILLTGLFAAGLILLFQLRFAAGDLYPHYSSLRSDPLGTRVLYESLQALPDKRLSANYSSMDGILMKAGVTVFMPGLSGFDTAMAGENWKGLLDGLYEKGGRLVISFSSAKHADKEKKMEQEENQAPVVQGNVPEGGEKEKNGKVDQYLDGKTGEKDRKKDEIRPDGPEMGIAYMPVNCQDPGEEPATAKAIKRPAYFPETIFWPSTGCFALEDPSWEVIYAKQNHPVMVSRKWGNGNVVLLADSYLLSNEGLQKNREPLILAWLAGSSGEVIFDEFHHGLRKTVGMVDLIKKYRFQGLLISLLVVVGLLIWRQTTLMPVATEPLEKQRRVFSPYAPDTAGAWIGLAERHISSKALLNICLDAWRKSEASGRVSKELQDHVGRIITAHGDASTPKSNRSTYTEIYQRMKQGKAL